MRSCRLLGSVPSRVITRHIRRTALRAALLVSLIGVLIPAVAVTATIGAKTASAATPQALILGPSTACTNSADCGVQDVFQNVDAANDGKSLEQQEAEAAGFQVTIVTTVQFQAMTPAEFAAYQVIIIGDPHCDADGAFPYGADANQSVWEGVVQATDGNKVVVGTDPVFHNDYSTQRGDLLIRNGIAFAGSRPGSTGAYIDLSCFYEGDNPGTAVPILDGLSSYGAHQFTVGGAPCAGNIAVVAQSGPTSGMTDGMLSGWECSVHEFFDQYPADYVPLAIATDPSVPQVYTAADVGGSGATVSGSPYVMIAGAGVSTRPTNGPTEAELQGGSALSENQTTCSTNQPVNCGTGDFWHTFNDFTIPGRGVPLSLTRTYSAAMAATNSPLGYGWTDSYNMTATVDSSGDVSVEQQNGSVVTFTPDGTGGYAAPSRVFANLAKNADGSYTFTPTRSGIAYEFSATGQLLSETDRNGYTTSLSYSAGQLSQVTDPAGRSLTFTYAGTNITEISDPAGRTETFTYDSSGNLQTATDPRGEKWTFTYDANHRLLTMTDPRGGVTSNTYNSAGQVTQQTDPANRTTTWSYSGDNTSPTGGTTTVTDPLGNQTDYFYQNLDLVSVTHAAGTALASTTTYAYDPITLGITSVTDPNGHVTKFTYDTQGNQLSATDPLGRATTATYNSLDEPLTTTDPSGITTTYTYDGNGNLTSIARPLTSTGQTATKYINYFASQPGDVWYVTAPNGTSTAFTYDNYGDLASSAVEVSGQWHTQQHKYDILGRLICTITADATTAGKTCPSSGSAPGVTTNTYDADSNLTAVVDPLGHTSSYTYDPDGNQVAATDGDQNVTHNVYDADNELLQTTQADGTTVKYGYDNDGNRTSVTDGNGHTTTYTYDQLNRTVESTDALGRSTSYGYDLAGNQTSMVDAEAKTTTYSYDAADQLTSIGYSDGATPGVNYTYDANGRRISMTDGTGTSTYSYDSLGRLTSTADGAGKTIGYGYDLNGNQTSITYPDGTTVNKTYDAANSLSTLTDGQGHTTSFSYDPDNNLTGQLYPNGDTATSTFDAADNLSAITENTAGAQSQFTYGRDNNSQITSSTGVEGNNSYTYDQLNRLTTDVPSAGKTTSYAYDPAGNLLDSPATGVAQHFDPANQLTSTGGITFVGSTSGSTSAGSSLTVSLPATTQPGDEVVVATIQASATPSGPSGYHQAASSTGPSGGLTFPGTNITVYTGQAPTSPGSVTVGYSSVTQAVVIVAVYRGVDASAPVETTTSGGAASSSTVTAASGTTTVAGAQLLLFQGATSAVTTSPAWTPPSGATEKQTAAATTTFGGYADQSLAPSSSFPSQTSGFSASGELESVAVALRPLAQSFANTADGQRSTSTNLTTGATQNYGWDQAGRMTSYTNPAGQTTAYTYNGDYLRITKTTTGQATQHFVWDTTADTPEMLTDGTTDYIYGPDGQPLEQYTAVPAVRFIGSASGNTAAGNLVTVTLPPGTAPGDEIFVESAAADPASENINAGAAGYTKVFSASSGAPTGSIPVQVDIFRKTADSNDTTVSVSYASAVSAGVEVAVYSGTDPNWLYRFHTQGLHQATTNSASSVTVSASPIQTPRDGDHLLVFQAASDTGAQLAKWTPPNGMSEANQTTAGTASAGLADQATPTRASSGYVTSTYTSTTASQANLETVAIAVEPPADTIYYHQDGRGDTRYMTDASGQITANYDYDPWGNLTAVGTNDSSTPLLYGAGYLDTESGLTYLVNRYYDAQTAQFLNIDPLAALTDAPYSYSADNPVDERDPSGLMPCLPNGTCGSYQFLQSHMQTEEPCQGASHDSGPYSTSFSISDTFAVMGGTLTLTDTGTISTSEDATLDFNSNGDIELTTGGGHVHTVLSSDNLVNQFCANNGLTEFCTNGDISTSTNVTIGGVHVQGDVTANYSANPSLPGAGGVLEVVGILADSGGLVWGATRVAAGFCVENPEFCALGG